MAIFTSEALLNALAASWDQETSYCPAEWSTENPARGQCVVSSLLIQHLLGGELTRVKTQYHGQPETHYFNVLPSGAVLDSTRSQYPADAVLTPHPVDLKAFDSVREKLLSDPDTKNRYELLKERVTEILA